MASPFGAPGDVRSSPFVSPPPLSGAPLVGAFGVTPAAGVPPLPSAQFGSTAAVSPPLPGGTSVPPPPATGATLTAPVAPTVAFHSTNGGAYAPAALAPKMDPVLTAAMEDIEHHNCSPTYMRSTVNRVPTNPSLKQKVPVPIGVVIQPLAPPGVGESEVPTVNFGCSGTIVRCRSCRTYVNPFVKWESAGRRWQCNLCGFSQVVPDSYFAPLDDAGKRSDRFQRPELAGGAVDFVAPGEYMVRPPQPPVFLFLINVSYDSVKSGMLDVVIASIKEAIESGSMPGGGDNRLQMGIVTYDTSLHFYNLNPSLSQPQMLVVSDLDDLFLPLPDGILVNLSDCEASILGLLDTLPALFSATSITESCMGSAIKGAHMAMKHIGGKLVIFDSCISSVGENALKSNRESNRLLGTEREVELLRPVGDAWKDFATECTKAQITIELFITSQAYVDVASIAPLAKHTGGDLRYYPHFTINVLGMKLKREIVHVLTRYMGWEAVMRVRASRGWKVTECFGHLHIRGVDLMVVPNCHADQTFTVTLDLDENVEPDPVICVQSALLYTNSNGERRIRVNTWAGIKAVQGIPEILGSIDVQASVCVLSHLALKQSLLTTLAQGRELLHNYCRQIIT